MQNLANKPLVTFFFMLTFFLLSSDLDEIKKFSLSIIAAFLAGATRLSAMPFAITILFYLLWAASSNKVRLLTFGIFSLLSVSTLFVLGTDFESANWNVLVYHTTLWGNATLAQKIASMLLMRPLIFIFGETSYTFYILLIFLFALLLVRETSLLANLKAYLLRHKEIPAIAAGIFLFMLSHLQGGNWYFEYFVPAIFVCIVILSIGCAKIYRQLKDQKAAQTLIAGIVGFSLVIFPVQQLGDWMDIGEGQTPISKVQRVSEYVSGFTRPDDPIIVLEALWVSIESKRDPMPGYTMAQFSYWPFSDKNDARRLKLVNLEILQEDILSGQAKAIILTDLDWETIVGKNSIAMCNALRKKYFLAFTTDQFGQHHTTVYVYRLNDGTSFPSDSIPDPCAKP